MHHSRVQARQKLAEGVTIAVEAQWAMDQLGDCMEVSVSHIPELCTHPCSTTTPRASVCCVRGRPSPVPTPRSAPGDGGD